MYKRFKKFCENIQFSKNTWRFAKTFQNSVVSRVHMDIPQSFNDLPKFLTTFNNNFKNNHIDKSGR